MKFRPQKQVCFISIMLVFAFALALPLTAASDKNHQPAVRVHFSHLIKAGKTQEALQAFKELAAYFKARFKEGSGQIYILKSNERDYLHSFMDYKDKASYKKTESAYFADAEFDTKLGQYLGLYSEGSYQYVVYKSIATIATETPVVDLSKGQEGRIYFTSINLGSFKEILAGEGQSKPVTISGTLKMPKKVVGKVPAVIILHGVGGVFAHYFEAADMLNEMGIAAFVVDSFETRGMTSVVDVPKKLFHSYSIRISDAYAALELVSTHPKIDRSRIAVLGYSMGARVALFVASEKIRWSFIADDLRFAASIGYYPPCSLQLKNIDFTDTPVLMLLAEKDNMAPIEPCLDYIQRIKDSGTEAEAIVYKGVHHGFPVYSGNQLVKVPSLADVSNCTKEELLLLLQDDGTWYSPHFKMTPDELDVLGKDRLNCIVYGEAIMGGNEEAKAKSIKAYQTFLRRVFNLN
ncbi:MAG: dienelactone hydrolase family protein [Desulfobacteraceae bacterium]|jgi:dienelactone hydrolase